MTVRGTLQCCSSWTEAGGNPRQNRLPNPTPLPPRGTTSSSVTPTVTMASQTEEHSYHAQDAVSAALKATSLTGGVGLFAAAVQNTLTKQNVGPMGVFIKSGGTIGIFGMYTALNNGNSGLGVILILMQRLWEVVMNSSRPHRRTCGRSRTTGTWWQVDLLLVPCWVSEVCILGDCQEQD